MNKDEFNSAIIDAISASCAIPFKIPTKEIERITKYAAKWFYRNHEFALENVYVLIPAEQYCNSKSFKHNRGIILSECVYSVNAVTKNNQFVNKSNGQSDITLDQYIYGNFGVGGGRDVGDAMYSDAVLAYVVYASWDDLLYHVTKHPLSYTFNPNTNRFFVKGDVKDNPDLVLDVMIKIPMESLYELDLFYHYVLGNAYMQLGNILGAFQMDLPGGATIDYSKWYDNGKEMVDDVKEEVKNMNSNDFFYTTNGQ